MVAARARLGVDRVEMLASLNHKKADCNRSSRVNAMMAAGGKGIVIVGPPAPSYISISDMFSSNLRFILTSRYSPGRSTRECGTKGRRSTPTRTSCKRRMFSS
jgi:hypothetical protein